MADSLLFCFKRRSLPTTLRLSWIYTVALDESWINHPMWVHLDEYVFLLKRITRRKLSNITRSDYNRHNFDKFNYDLHNSLHNSQLNCQININIPCYWYYLTRIVTFSVSQINIRSRTELYLNYYLNYYICINTYVLYRLLPDAI